MKFKVLMCLLFLWTVGNCEENREHCSATTQPSQTSKDVTFQSQLLLASTLKGDLHAVSKRNGMVKWTMGEDPIITVPMNTNTIKGPTFLPDPQNGALYTFEPTSQGLSKLPFTIPELVRVAPCQSSDGILYTGSKQDKWFSVNPFNGVRHQVITTDTTVDKCPGDSSNQIYIGRSEYRITMFDTKTRHLRWNVTFKDYSPDSRGKMSNNYDLLHLASTSDGYMVTINKNTGDILWDHDYGSPVVKMFVTEGNGVHEVEVMKLAKETILYLVRQPDSCKISLWNNVLHWHEQFSDGPKETTLIPSLYIGNFMNGLYAMPVLTHEAIMPQQNVPLLPGPPASHDDKLSSSTDVQVEYGMPIAKLVGYHKVPPGSKTWIPNRGPTPTNSFPLITDQHTTKYTQTTTLPPQVELPPPIDTPTTEEPTMHKIHEFEIKHRFNDKYRNIFNRYALHKETLRNKRNLKREQDAIKQKSESTSSRWGEITSVAVTTSIITVLMVAFVLKNFFGGQHKGYGPDGQYNVGQISFHPADIIGKGSEGTVVYRGKFDGRECAVKRIVPHCLTLADREVAMLRAADQHANVIRYYCTEKDRQFRYIALELCHNTLQEYVEDPIFQSSVGLSTVAVLRQAMKGLHHLHSLSIVHRDIKPSNILISQPNALGEHRVLISDFGLCKKLVGGRLSFSQRSGLAGTDGWIAPEMLMTDKYRMTCAVDIFSMGCVFYYVMCGSHPFGDSLSRQSRIISADYSLDNLYKIENSEECCDVIERMLFTDPSLRPTSETVLSHPMFWDCSTKLHFLQDVSDRTEQEPADSEVMLRLEWDSSPVVAEDWSLKLCEPLRQELNKFRSYRGNSVRDLLRAMRNKKHHYRELPANVKVSLGSLPDEFTQYFLTRFPRLLMHTYHAIAVCRREMIFKHYYGSSAQSHLFKNTDVTNGRWTEFNNYRSPRRNADNINIGHGQVNKFASDGDMNWRVKPINNTNSGSYASVLTADHPRRLRANRSPRVSESNWSPGRKNKSFPATPIRNRNNTKGRLTTVDGWEIVLNKNDDFTPKIEDRSSETTSTTTTTENLFDILDNSSDSDDSRKSCESAKLSSTNNEEELDETENCCNKNSVQSVEDEPEAQESVEKADDEEEPIDDTIEVKREESELITPVEKPLKNNDKIKNVKKKKRIRRGKKKKKNNDDCEEEDNDEL